MTNIMTTDNEDTPSVRDKLGCFGSTVGIAFCGLGFVFLLFFGLVYGKFNGLHNAGVKKEQALSAQYQDNQNELSSTTLKIKETLGVASAKSDALDKVLTDAVVGRYQAGNSAQGATDGNAKLFSAVVEAYPDLKGLDTYDKVIDTINSGREAYKNKQSKLLDMVRDYKTWQHTGLIDEKLISLAGFPSNDLTARVGQKVTHGQEALDQIETIILDADTQQAYTTGIQGPLVTQAPPTTAKK